MGVYIYVYWFIGTHTLLLRVTLSALTPIFIFTHHTHVHPHVHPMSNPSVPVHPCNITLFLTSSPLYKPISGTLIVPSAVVELIMRKAAGSPLICIELATALYHSGHVVVTLKENGGTFNI